MAREKERATIVASALLLSLTTACADSTCDGATADAIYLVVVDADTASPIEATIQATRGDRSLDVTCIDRPYTSEPCERWAIGLGVTGEVIVEVAAEGYIPALATFDIASASCGPASQQRTIPLQAI